MSRAEDEDVESQAQADETSQDTGPVGDTSPDVADEPTRTTSEPSRTRSKSQRRNTRLDGARLQLDLMRMNVGDKWERLTFIVVLVTISAFIFVTKAFLGLPAWIGLAVSAVGIFGYGLLAWLDRNNRVRMDKAGDNCYYLGLTFTLSSLAAVLVRIDFDVSVAQYIISGFGIAIGSTIFGIIARLILIQFVEELDDIEQRARVRLTESADQLRVDLENAAGRFQDFMISIQDEVRVSIVAVTEEPSKQQRALVEAVEAALKDAIGTMEQSSLTLAETLKGHAGVMTKFNAASERSAKAADNLADKVSGIELPYDQLEDGVGKLVQEIQRVRDGIMSLPITDAAGKLDAYAKTTDQVIEKVAALGQATDRIVAGLKEVNVSLSGSAQDGAAAAKALQDTVRDLQTGMVTFRAVATSYVDGMKEVAEVLAEKVDV